MTEVDAHLELFGSHRGAVVGAAYRILASRHDAEDVAQETWLRWTDVELSAVDDPRAYLVTMAGRLALNRERAQQRRRETYVGPWLPEPIVGSLASAPGWASGSTPGSTHGDPEQMVELADSVSMAMLVVLSSLSPLERAAFVLREVFDVDYDEVAQTLGRSEPAVRQLVHRARSHVAARAPRRPVDDHEHARVTEQFLAAVQGGSVSDLLELLAPDAVLVTDGGGLKQAALRPIVGADKIIRFLTAVIGPVADLVRSEVVEVNGGPGVAVWIAGELDTVGVLDVVDGRARALYLVRNPEKLVGLTPRAAP